MKFNLKSLLKDKNVLYVVFFLAVVNLFGYLMVGDTESVIFFLVVGFLATYFSKNMIVVMVAAMLLTNLLVASKHVGNNVKEGLQSATTKERKEAANPVSSGKASFQEGLNQNRYSASRKKEKQSKEKMTKLSPASVEDDDDKPNIDYASTVEAAYDNIDKLLSSDALKNMSEDTQRLAEKQNQLQNNITKV